MGTLGVVGMEHWVYYKRGLGLVQWRVKVKLFEIDFYNRDWGIVGRGKGESSEIKKKIGSVIGETKETEWEVELLGGGGSRWGGVMNKIIVWREKIKWI
jgi:hypothetical protein